MPYRRGWLAILVLMAAAVLAFWPGYFSVLGQASIDWHLHAVTASLWMALLVAQNWTAHSRRLPLHRALGLATFVAVPLFIAGGLAVLRSMAAATIAGDPFYAMYGARLGSYDTLSTTAFAVLVAMALKERRKVRLHAGYMMATSLLLIGAVMSRITDKHLPGLIIHGPQDFPLFAWNLHLASLVAIAIAGWLYRADPRNGRPWLIVGGVTLAQSLVFETFARTALWSDVYLSLARVPWALLMVVGLVAGIAAVWIGWNAAPARRTAIAPAEAAPAS
jgi:hypothetical protein